MTDRRDAVADALLTEMSDYVSTHWRRWWWLEKADAVLAAAGPDPELSDFGELVEKVCSQRFPIMPQPNWRQNAAFVGWTIDRWVRHAENYGRDVDQLRRRVAELEADQTDEPATAVPPARVDITVWPATGEVRSHVHATEDGSDEPATAVDDRELPDEMVERCGPELTVAMCHLGDENPTTAYTSEGYVIWRDVVIEKILTAAGVPDLLAAHQADRTLIEELLTKLEVGQSVWLTRARQLDFLCREVRRYREGLEQIENGDWSVDGKTRLSPKEFIRAVLSERVEKVNSQPDPRSTPDQMSDLLVHARNSGMYDAERWIISQWPALREPTEEESGDEKLYRAFEGAMNARVLADGPAETMRKFTHAQIPLDGKVEYAYLPIEEGQ